MSITATDTPTAADVMNRHVRTVTPDMALGEVIAYMLKHQVSSVPVLKEVDGKQKLVGLVSEADCLEYLSNEMFFGNPVPPQRAETIMKRHLLCVAPEDDVFTLASILTSHRYRHMPVVRGDQVVGIVSRRDVLKAITEYYRKWSTAHDRNHFPVDLHKIMNLRFLGSRD